MKKTRKTKRPSYRAIKTQLESIRQENLRLINDERTQRTKADKYEKAYRTLKDTLGQYLAMFAGDYGVDHERAKHLQEKMFAEPQEALSGLSVMNTDFGSIYFKT